jgi:two-component system, OmpR family, sensor histidine kinase ArlS
MKLRLKIILMNVITITFILMASGYFILSAADNSNLYSMQQYLLKQSDFCELLILDSFKLENDGNISLAKTKQDLLIILKKYITSDIQIWSSAIKNPTLLQKQALEGRKAYLIDTSGSVRVLSLCFPVYFNDKLAGIINLKESLYQADQMRSELFYTSLIVLIITIFTLILLSYLFSYRMIKPLEKLTLASKKFSKGEFKEISGIDTRDEIEALAKGFNEMGNAINSMILELKSEQKKQKDFFDNVTHEIRTPLTNIIGYADLLKRVSDKAEREKYLSYITSESNRLVIMVNNLLELSRFGTFEETIEKMEFKLKPLALEVIDLMRDTSAKFGFKIESELEDITILADRNKLKQVIINLIDNAIKHSDGSIIKIKVDCHECAQVRLEISDNGIGISQKELQNLMKPFYRIDKSRSRQHGGSGLGLSICENIITAHNGTLTITSEAGIGTTVTILLHP